MWPIGGRVHQKNALPPWNFYANNFMTTIRLPHEFLTFLRLLNQSGSKYLLIGGYAVAHYGYVRATGDMDVFVECSKENARTLTDACKEFGLGDSVSEETFLVPGQILRFGLPPMRLEILNEISGVSFEDCWKSKKELQVEGITIPIISLEDLLKNKRASGRTKDQIDIEQLTDSDSFPQN
mgnify:CR=1 FL=1